MIEEVRADHWTDRETDPGLSVLGGAPVRVPAAAEPWEQEADAVRPAGRDPLSSLTAPAPWCC